MTTNWTIKSGATEKSLAAWGVKALTRRLRLQTADEATFFEPVSLMEADLLFPIDGTLQIYKTVGAEKLQWFEGTLLSARRSMNKQVSGRQYTVVNAWYQLDNHLFQQIWKSYTGDPDNLVDVPSSHLLLGTKVVDNVLVRQSVHDQIKEILDYAITSGVSLQYDLTGIPTINLPVDELRDQSCGDAIRRQLKWLPDVVASWDYSLSPPKLIFAKRDAIEPVELKVFDAKKISDLEIDERYDLRRPAVVLKYEISNNNDGFSWVEHAVDKKPDDATGTELKALVMTIDLEGVSRSTSSAYVAVQPIHIDDVAWWKPRVSWLEDEKITSIELSDPFRSGVLGLANELVDGSFAPWMETDLGLKYEQETVTIQAVVTFEDGTIREELLNVDINSTNAITKTYYTVDSFTEGELPPVGLAEELYNAVNRREQEGKFSLKEQECSGLLLAGFTFNFPDGRDEWKTMRALINESTELVDDGRTELQFGPPPYLAAGELVELLRANRQRWIYQRSNTRANAQVGIDNRIELPKTTAKRNTAAGTNGHQRIMVKRTVSDKTGHIDIDAAKAIYGGEERPMEPRLMPYEEKQSDGSCKTRKIIVLASEPFDS